MNYLYFIHINVIFDFYHEIYIYNDAYEQWKKHH